MMEYRHVVQFYYKNNMYNMYLDNKNKHFFLKTDNEGKLYYVTIEELLELTYNFISVPLVMNVKKESIGKTIKLIPKVLIGTAAVTLSFITLVTSISMYNSQKRIKEFLENYNASNKTITEKDFENYIAYNYDEIEKNNEDLIVDTYLESDRLKYLFIYDMDYLDKALNYDNVCLEDFNNVINSNNKISEKFKKILYKYCENVTTKYPDIELRVLYENLKTLEVVECDERELLKKTLSIDSSGCYIRTENKIYVPKDYEYKEGTWDYQVIFHEISHCLRTAVWEKDETEIKVQVEGQNFYNTITSEALNSLFTVSLFDYEEKDIAYQLQSNYHKIMIDSMDNYSLSDYVNHSLSYYAKKLDEFNEDENYATVILTLIQVQYDDYHSNSINVVPSGYYPIYEYISDMYYKKNINPEMTYQEAIQVTEELISKILFDVPEEYNIDTNYFYKYLDEYCSKIGIKNTSKIR